MIESYKCKKCSVDVISPEIEFVITNPFNENEEAKVCELCFIEYSLLVAEDLG